MKPTDRKVFLDTETTGFDPTKGDRVIEIGAVEAIGREVTGRNFHVYLNPERIVPEEATRVHGLTNDFLADKPKFAEVAKDLIEFISGAEVVIHNAPFDTKFLNAELVRLGSSWGRVQDHCAITDSLVMARRLHRGGKNTLDALCERHGIDNAHRELHGALLDSEILAEVYFAMTRGQDGLSFDEGSESALITRIPGGRPQRIVTASMQEAQAHADLMQKISAASGSEASWGVAS